MTFLEKTEQMIKEFMYQKGRNKNHHSKEDNASFFNELLDSIDEMEDYIDSKIKEHQISKKR